MHAAESGISILALCRIGLPISSVSSKASSVECFSMRFANLCSRLLRCPGAIRDQCPFSKEARAAFTAPGTAAPPPAARELRSAGRVLLVALRDLRQNAPRCRIYAIEGLAGSGIHIPAVDEGLAAE